MYVYTFILTETVLFNLNIDKLGVQNDKWLMYKLPYTYIISVWFINDRIWVEARGFSTYG